MSQNMAVIIAHPGHELRILQWIMNVRPEIYILTDGSGSRGISRIDESLLVINKAKAKKSEFFGLMSDKQFYNEILNKNTDFFVDLAEKIYVDISDKKIDLIAGDANEGFNTMHDICRNIINAIVIKSKKNLDKEILNYEFMLEDINACSACNNDAIIHHLSISEIKTKTQIIESFHTLKDEVNKIREKFGATALETECLNPANTIELSKSIEQPFYEKYAISQINKGVYQNLISYKEHIYPIFKAIERWSLE